MNAVKIKSIDNSAVELKPKNIMELSNALGGNLLTPGDEGYDESRRVWNGMIDKRPAMIARCRSAEDVVHAISFARTKNLAVAVKGGGHSVAGSAISDGGFNIDLSPMKTVEVDEKNRTAQVGPGCLLNEVDKATQPYGLAVPAGIVSTTGVAGLCLGGGYGWNSRKYGLTVDNLISADIVTADARRVTASESENADLFWAIRGGGGNFGVATSFRFRLQEVGPQVYCGLIVHRYSDAKKFMQLHRDFVKSAPDDMSAWMVIRKAPPLPFLDKSVHGSLIVAVPFIYVGNESRGEKLIDPLRKLGNPHGEHIGMNHFADWQQTFDPLHASGLLNYWKSHNLNDLSDPAIDCILEYSQKFPSPHCEILVGYLGGAVSREAMDKTAYAHRDAPFFINIHTRWESPSDNDRCISWARDLFEALRPHSTGGVYVNFMSDEGKQRVRDAYPATVWDRLVTIKTKYDPQNMFRFNQNIEPAAM